MSRPEPQRAGPRRASLGPEAGATGASGGPSHSGDDSVSESVAHVVKLGYEVIAENLRQGREAAARFRQGEYNVRDVPGDLETVLLRLIHLARDLSTTTFDVCERLLKEVGAQRPQPPRDPSVPPFRPTPTPAPPSTTGKGAPDTGRMKLTVRFSGSKAAIARTDSLSRPTKPTAPSDLSATPLAPRAGNGKPITGVSFETDMSVEGLIAVVKVPKSQATGSYSGLVYAAHDDVPLGVLTIEVSA